jgi:hypothetical protein
MQADYYNEGAMDMITYVLTISSTLVITNLTLNRIL